MKSLNITILALVLTACGTPGSSGRAGIDGQSGVDGSSGAAGQEGETGSAGPRGHSVVAKARTATILECTQTPGTAVDFYLDKDDSLNWTPGDVLQAGVVTCNGMAGVNGTNGSNGSDGAPGSAGTNATMVSISLSATACQAAATGIWVRRDGDQASLYTASDCNIPSTINMGNNVALTAQANEVYTSGNTVLIVEGQGANMVLKKLVY